MLVYPASCMSVAELLPRDTTLPALIFTVMFSRTLPFSTSTTLTPDPRCQHESSGLESSGKESSGKESSGKESSGKESSGKESSGLSQSGLGTRVANASRNVISHEVFIEG
jgi:hypothetical protein